MVGRHFIKINDYGLWIAIPKWVLDHSTGMFVVEHEYFKNFNYQEFEEEGGLVLFDGVSVETYVGSRCHTELVKCYRLPKDIRPPLTGVSWVYVEPGVWVVAK